MLKFSIVTACLNREAFIRDAVESVLAQNYPNFEHLIVDGGSTDRTLDLLKEYDHVNVESGPDDGIYDAWNKGISRCTGDVIGILNSDDFYADGVFWEVAGMLKARRDVEVITGKALQFREKEDGSWAIDYEYVEERGKHLDLLRMSVWAPVINARFFRAQLLKRIGGFDTNYSIAADCDYSIRMTCLRPTCLYLDRHIYFYRTHPGSISLDQSGRNDWLSYREKLSIAESWLTGAKLDLPGRRALRWQHSTKATVGGLAFLFRGEIRRSLSFFIRGQSWNWLFVISILKELYRITVYQLRKLIRRHEKSIQHPPIAHLSNRKRVTNFGGG